MPIQQINFEGRPPVFTWATKPAANAVPVGYTITITEFWRSDWYSDGTYWRPKGGQATLLVQDLTAFSYASTTLDTPAGYTSPVIPWSQLMAVPGFEIDTYLEVLRDTPATTQGSVAAARATETMNLAYFIRSNTHQTMVAAGTLTYAGVGLIRHASQDLYKEASSSIAGLQLATPPDGPVLLRLQTGGAGETIFPKILQVVYRA